jgi:hypothetical protein
VPKEVNSHSDRHQFTVVEEVAAATVEVSVAVLDSLSAGHGHLQSRESLHQAEEAWLETIDLSNSILGCLC